MFKRSVFSTKQILTKQQKLYPSIHYSPQENSRFCTAFRVLIKPKGNLLELLLMHATDAVYIGRCRSFLKKVAENDTFVFNTKINSITLNNEWLI